jgi:hypothetical protein
MKNRFDYKMQNNEIIQNDFQYIIQKNQINIHRSKFNLKQIHPTQDDCHN